MIWKWLGIASLMLVLWGCGSGGKEDAHFHQLKGNDSAPSLAFPGPPVPLSQTLSDAIERMEYLTYIVPVRRFIKLEAREESVVGEIKNLVRIEDSWFILDGLQDRIFQFGEKGNFIRVVGGKGSGPGEYVAPEGIRKVWGDHLAVADRGRIIVFNKRGEFVRAFSLEDQGAQLTLLVNHNFIWEDLRQLYIGNFPTHNLSSPLHAYVTYANQQFDILHGFGERYLLMEKATADGTIPSWSYDCFIKVGQRIWTGSPYSAQLDIFDLEGRLLGHVKRRHPLQITNDDFEKVNPRSREQVMELFYKYRNFGLLQLDKLVLTYLSDSDGFILDIHDTEGNLLRSNIRGLTPYYAPKAAYGNKLVGVLSIYENLEEYRKVLSEHEMMLLKEAGWDPDNAVNDNPYLIIGELVE